MKFINNLRQPRRKRLRKLLQRNIREVDLFQQELLQKVSSNYLAVVHLKMLKLEVNEFVKVDRIKRTIESDSEWKRYDVKATPRISRLSNRILYDNLNWMSNFYLNIVPKTIWASEHSRYLKLDIVSNVSIVEVCIDDQIVYVVKG